MQLWVLPRFGVLVWGNHKPQPSGRGSGPAGPPNPAPDSLHGVSPACPGPCCHFYHFLSRRLRSPAPAAAQPRPRHNVVQPLRLRVRTPPTLLAGARGSMPGPGVRGGGGPGLNGSRTPNGGGWGGLAF